jgi:hypothetical protein
VGRREEALRIAEELLTDIELTGSAGWAAVDMIATLDIDADDRQQS